MSCILRNRCKQHSLKSTLHNEPLFTTINGKQLFLIKPLEDTRWDAFVAGSPQSSVFHASGWLEALRLTYGYQPVAITTCAPRDPLKNAWPFCSIRSWLTGARWASLPFSDHCQPLVDPDTYNHVFLAGIEAILGQNQLAYLEGRPLLPIENVPQFMFPKILSSRCSYCFHHVDLTPDRDRLFRNCHKDSTQRKIYRAQREHLRYAEGHSPELLDAFFDLQVSTRSRHGYPPPPKEWFKNISRCVGEAAKIRVAYKDRVAVAAIMTLRFNDTIMYKYGGSDPMLNKLGGMHLLLWKTVEEAKEDGLRRLDLGRSDPSAHGLITFKDRWGSVRSHLSYTRFTRASSPKTLYQFDKERSAHLRVLANLPKSVVQTIGKVIYRHMG